MSNNGINRMGNQAYFIIALCMGVLSCARVDGVDVALPDGGRHLFILSGQSNMVGLDPEVSFTPSVTKAFGVDKILVVKDAHSGQSIRSWCKSNHEFPPPTSGRVPKVRGELYDRLIGKVKKAIEGQALETVTFVWMQGESDLNNTAYDVYLKELLEQLQADLTFEKINVVIGRISDSGLDVQKRLQGRLKIRRIQREFAEAHPRGTWVDTDDLNDRREGDKVLNDLHYTAEGYRTLGTRFAEKAIALVKDGKHDVGNHLALWALAKTSGKDMVYAGPIFKGIKIEGKQVRVCFAHAQGLKSSDGKALTEFKVITADGKSIAAKAEIDGETVVISAGRVTPVAVQFGWHKLAKPNLVNGAGLPAAPFHSDHWQGATDE